MELAEDMLGNDGAQFHRFLALVEVLPHLFTCDPDHTTGHHRHDGGPCRTSIEIRGIINHELSLEREPCDMFPVIADAVCHVLEATALHEGEPTVGEDVVRQTVTPVRITSR